MKQENAVILALGLGFGFFAWIAFLAFLNYKKGLIEPTQLWLDTTDVRAGQFEDIWHSPTLVRVDHET